MTQHIRRFVTVTVCLLTWPASAHADRRFQAGLASFQQVPLISRPQATGRGTVVLNAAETEITVNLTFENLTGAPTAAHIHGAAGPGTNAGVVFTLSGLTAGASGTMPPQTFSITASQVSDLKSGQFYFNIHTSANGSGEIRGQILTAPDEQFSTRLNGARQVPAVSSSGYGVGTVWLNALETSITVNLSFGGLSSAATAAHIHGPADSSNNAGVRFALTGVPAAISGSIASQSFDITAAQVAELRAGQLYFNIHTGSFGSGEIRGQVATAPATPLTAALNGTQQVPAVSTSATGTGTVLLNYAEDTIYVNLTYSGLSGAPTAAHIHGPATFGNNGGAIFDVSAALPAAASGTIVEQEFSITPSQVTDLKAGRYYLNVHTSAFGSGEIRGQVLRAAPKRYMTTMSGSQEVPANSSTGAGLASVILNGTETEITAAVGSTTLESNASAAHIHGPAAAGSTAGAPFGFEAVQAAQTIVISDQSYAITPAQVADLKAGLHYVNVHTGSYPSGELRGQLTANPNLTIGRAGNGTATSNITSDPPGIDCGGDCSEPFFPQLTTVTLTPGTAASGSYFAGWLGGGCTGTGTCSLTAPSTALTVTAVYGVSSSAITFTDDPLSAGTAVKAVHVTELRTAVNTLRGNNGLGAFSFSDSTISGASIKAIHITELRTALAAVFTQRGWSTPVYSDATIATGATIRARHIHELRLAVRAIE